MDDTGRTSLALARTREHFHEVLDLRQHKLARIVESYVEKEKVLCGLSSCRTGHNKGYIVETVDGWQTNIGHVCGRVHLGADFRRLENAFRARKRDALNFAVIEAFQERAPEFLQRTDALWNGERGGWWIEECQRLLQKLPSRVQTRLREHVRSGRAAITKTEMSQDEDDDISFLSTLGFGGATRGVSRVVGELRGLDGANLLSLANVRADVVMPIRRFAKISPGAMRRAERHTCVTLATSIEERIHRLSRWIEEGRRFFDEKNLRELSKLAHGSDEKRQVARVTEAIQRLQVIPGAGQQAS